MYNAIMRKILSLLLILVLVSLCACETNNEISDTRFHFDTVVTITADCDQETLNGAFAICEKYEKLLSRTVETSDVSILNNSEGFCEVSAETLEIIKKSLFYSKLSGGKFDITILPASKLWDFRNQIMANFDAIETAILNIGYEAIEIEGNKVNLNGRKIDLGAIAKGYIADKIKEYFIEKGVEDAIINLGGNIVCIGDEADIGIAYPFEKTNIAAIKVKNQSVVTSGIYERYIQNGNFLFHHILDPDTGYPVENNLASVTVLGESSADCDALSTLCMVLGEEKGKEIIEKLDGYEAVFITRGIKMTSTSGLKLQEDAFVLK